MLLFWKNYRHLYKNTNFAFRRLYFSCWFKKYLGYLGCGIEGWGVTSAAGHSVGGGNVLGTVPLPLCLPAFSSEDHGKKNTNLSSKKTNFLASSTVETLLTVQNCRSFILAPRDFQGGQVKRKQLQRRELVSTPEVALNTHTECRPPTNKKKPKNKTNAQNICAFFLSTSRKKKKLLTLNSKPNNPMTNLTRHFEK